MSIENTAVFDDTCDPPIIRTRQGSFEVDISARDDEERKALLENIRSWLSKNAQAMLEAQTALAECAKKAGKWVPTIAVMVTSDDYGYGMYVAIGLEIYPNRVDVQHWEGAIGEDTHVFYLGTIERIEETHEPQADDSSASPRE